jgi:small subunit ribosomal protein S17
MTNKIYTGKVVSNKMEKTVVVAITRLFQHPVYKKTVKKISKFKVHDEANECKAGDTVRIVETRPLSKEKRWKVFEIVNKQVRSNEK